MEFAPAQRTELSTFDAYLASLSEPLDSFEEEAIIESAHYRISIDDVEVGSFAVHDGALLTQFHMVGAARRLGQEALARILDEHRVTAAYVPTSDNFLLSHAVDREHVLKRQAYLFAEGVPGPVAAETKLDYRPATVADVATITDVSGDFLDRLEARIADGEVHVGWDGDELVAVGIAESGRLVTGHASIGMFTSEAHRRRGIGRTTLRYLRNVCHANGVTPIAGCWYYNTASKLTLEAAGMIAVARLLRIEFVS
jgi:GNAT superfamily N-acetyltransferase